VNNLCFYEENIHFHLFRLASLTRAVVITSWQLSVLEIWLLRFWLFHRGGVSAKVHLDLVTIYLRLG